MSGATVAIAAISIGYAAATAFETFAVIAAVGATVAAVGTIAHVKELQIAGSVIGAIGGIGSLATSAGIFGADAASSFGEAGVGELGLPSEGAGAASSTGGWATDSGTFGASLSGEGGMSGAATVGAASPSVSTGQDLINTVSGEAAAPITVDPTNPGLANNPLQNVAVNAAAPDVSPTAATDVGVPNTQMSGQESVDASGQISQGSDTGIPNPPTAPAPAAPGTSSGTGPSTPTGQATETLGGKVGGIDVSSKLINANNGAGISITRGGSLPAVAGSQLQASSDVWGDILGVIGKPGVGTLASGVIQAGASFLAGATNGLTPAQIAALNAQAEANHAAANLARMQQSNMSEPIPVASRTPPVTGAPVGLINTPRPNPVTGATA